jgi:hypothetical protein
MKKLTVVVMLLIAVLWVMPAFAQSAAGDKPADNMQILRDKIKADKKLLVAANMELTESEAKGFWPVYDAYQKDLEALNKRAKEMVKTYADAWNTKSMNNEKAKKLTTDFLTLQADEVKLMQSYVPKLGKVLPDTKVARYLQLENKIRTIVKYDVAAGVPLVPSK